MKMYEEGAGGNLEYAELQILEILDFREMDLLYSTLFPALSKLIHTATGFSPLYQGLHSKKRSVQANTCFYSKREALFPASNKN